MRFIANKMNGEYLMNILPTKKEDVEVISQVYAAIAYGTNENEKFVQNCIENKLRLNIWMRYDHTVPVAPELLRKLNRPGQNIFCKVIRDYLHSKVMWWKGYGAYIGSANLTQSAWNSNIEAGLFLNEDELLSNGMDGELESFFSSLQPFSIDLTNEIIEEQESLKKQRKDKEQDLNSHRNGLMLDKLPSPVQVGRQDASERDFQTFQNEWMSSLTILRGIADRIQDFRPNWLVNDYPTSWQADQFLHAYYYGYVRKDYGRAIPYNDFHRQNASDSNGALEQALEWWRDQEEPPSGEDENLETRRKFQEILPPDFRDLGKEELLYICRHNFALYEHLRKIAPETMGFPAGQRVERAVRCEWHADCLERAMNNKGWDIGQLFRFVLYDHGDDMKEAIRNLFTAANNPEYKFARVGLNTLSELMGWVRPDFMPPRNGRTSKALYALGYSVELR